MLLCGALFAVFERKDFARPVFTSRYFRHGAVFATIFNAAVAYAVWKFPDWMWMYFIGGVRHSAAELVYIFLFLYYFPYALGFYLGFDFKNRSLVAWVALLAFLAAAEAWIIAHLFDRYSVIGTRAEYEAGTAVSLFSPDNPIGPVMNGSVVLMAAYFGWVVWRRRKTRKSLRD